jgi:hypothetical protein
MILDVPNQFPWGGGTLVPEIGEKLLPSFPVAGESFDFLLAFRLKIPVHIVLRAWQQV